MPGENPMRWNCDRDGCFNKKRRPKIEVFAECFPRRINFGDVDGLVELNGRFCLLEWKGNGGALQPGGGQWKSYVKFTLSHGNVVFVVHGDAETMDVKGYSFFWQGKPHPFIPASLVDLKNRFKSWTKFVETDIGTAA